MIGRRCLSRALCEAHAAEQVQMHNLSKDVQGMSHRKDDDKLSFGTRTQMD